MTRTTRLLLAASACAMWATTAFAPVNFTRRPIDTSFPAPTAPHIRFPLDVEAANLDGDSDLDLVVSVTDYSGSGEGLFWYQHTSAFGFTKTYIDTMLIDVDVDPVRVDAKDIDDDLDIDIVMTGHDRTYLYKNNGTGTFTRTVIESITGALRRAEIADLDGDTDEDVALLSNNGLYWLQNDGSETFTRFTIDANPVTDVALTLANMDGDADVDVIASTLDISGSRYFAWYENLGGGSFFRHVFDVQSGTEDVADAFVFDVDRDGLLDITIAKFTDNTIWWYEDTGAHVYVPHIVTTTFAQAPMRVWVADLNNDTYDDIVALGGNSAIGEVVYWENDGEQNFTYHSIESTAGNRQGLCVVDFDFDTVPDVLVTNAFPAELVWFDNLGTSTDVRPSPAATVQVYPNFPNPFNPSTTIGYTVTTGLVDVEVFAVNGTIVRRLVHEQEEAGYHEVHWDGRDDSGRRVVSGVYVVRVKANGAVAARKVNLVM